MKRFTNEGYKLRSPRLSVESRLTLRSKAGGVSRSYTLLSSVCHHGSSSRSGHYTAYCRFDDRWFHFNDERVSEVTRHIDSSDTLEDSYILFYVEDSICNGVSSRL